LGAVIKAKHVHKKQKIKLKIVEKIRNIPKNQNRKTEKNILIKKHLKKPKD
jgi:hypothetical protein